MSGEGEQGTSPRRRIWIAAAAAILVITGVTAVFVLSHETTSRMCTLAGVIDETTSDTPDEAAREFAERADGPGALDSPDGFQRRSETEWRKDLGNGRYRRLQVDEVPGEGWRVIDFNTCSERTE